MRTVSTEEQFKEALEQREKKILCKGEVAKKFQQIKKRKKMAKTGGIAIALAGLAAAPFTGGISLAGTAMGLTVGALTISAGELAIILGAAVAIYGISRGCKITFNSDGTVTVEPKYDSE